MLMAGEVEDCFQGGRNCPIEISELQEKTSGYGVLRMATPAIAIIIMILCKGIRSLF
jgi:hypothetical protein